MKTHDKSRDIDATISAKFYPNPNGALYGRPFVTHATLRRRVRRRCEELARNVFDGDAKEYLVPLLVRDICKQEGAYMPASAWLHTVGMQAFKQEFDLLKKAATLLKEHFDERV